ncbi:non-ribosomal peptide synthetase [Pedobacter cryoconitis]|uniref:Amino acid adenylation domain-containing protein/non-ribosomal peptide synthase protein (TIGR01720 family) n=1 Tax=Pedobacter cryoconitis TaxID=188932 RepID=A0A7X0J122_9SPHI|nr:non-ribosomal peptide synthetase [Pedobacter cryoconitis]MBB6498472.1 amino acid adenylation domain-containing protein/non-ribosomal peptide synthase protein (TIGR01720 family) [Pedobacter cryoconitis]
MSFQILPLHPAQKDVYIDQMINTEAPYYNVGGYILLKGLLDKEKFIAAVNSAPLVFDALKMRFDLQDPQPVAYLDETYDHFELPELVFEDGPDKKERVGQWIREQLAAPFKIEKTSIPVEQYLIQVQEDEYWYYFKFHHLIADGYGLSGLNQFIARKYKSLITADYEVEFKYPSYVEEAIRASAYHNSAEYAAEGEYWKKKVGKQTENLFQRRILSDNNLQTKSDTLILELTEKDRERLETLQLNTKANPQQLTMAALMIYFARTSSQTDFVFGIPLHRRRTKALRTIPGMFTGLIPFVGHCSPGTKLTDLIKSILSSQREDYRYQNYLIGDLKRFFRMETQLAADALTEIVVNYAPIDFQLDFGEGLKSQSINIPTGHVPFPIEMFWYDYGKQQPLQLRVDFQLQYFEKKEIELLTQRILYILEQFDTKLDNDIEAIHILPPAEQILLEEFSHQGACTPESAQTLPGLFAVQAALTPDAIAIRFEKQLISYKQLDEQSNQLSHYLRGQGVTTDSMVLLCMNRSIDMLVAILGVMKAGGAYVPVDPAYPAERINYILNDTSSGIVICNDESRASVIADVDMININDETLLLSRLPADYPAAVPGTHDLCYVIYTSGSTGKPKGVMVEHRGMLNHLFAKVADLQMNEQTRLAFTASSTFDISVWQMFAALLCGGSTVVYTDRLIYTPAELISAVAEDQVTILELVPSYLTAVLQEEMHTPLENLRYLLVTGEAVSQYLLNQWFTHPYYGTIPVVNAYGPTEASDDITHHFMYETPVTANVPLGKPLQNLRIYVLNESNEICHVGLPGEICVAGIGVARGYVGLPELTAQKFTQDIFSMDPSERMYRTGDLGRWLADGNIEYLGRIDDQVKIRGYRIELGEIESVLQQSELVREAVVLARADDKGHKRLIGYIVPVGKLDKENIVAYMRERLPEYMVPGMLVEMVAFPLTPNGKIDKKGLPDLDTDVVFTDDYVPAGNDVEEFLAVMWQELLGIERIGIHDNFFKLGGDSIIIIQLASRAKRAGYALQAKDVFQHQTIAQLAAWMSGKKKKNAGIAAGEEHVKGEAGLLPIQQWYFEQEPQETRALHHYNQSLLLKADKTINAELLSAVLSHLLEQHDALRFSYQRVGRKWSQTYGNQNSSLYTEDLSEAGSELSSLITTCCEQYQASLDLEKGDILRMVLIKTPESDTHNRLLIVVHHLAIDGVSWRILLEDIEELIAVAQSGKEMELAGKSSSYQRWYNHLTAYAQSNQLLSQRQYWENIALAKCHPLVENLVENSVLISDSKTYTAGLNATFTHLLLKESHQAYHTEINDILLAALVRTLTEWNGKKEVIIGLEGHGREEIGTGIDISRTVGWFTSLYPVLVDAGINATDEQLIKNVKEQLHGIPDKGLGYGILKYINKETVLQGDDPWEIVFNYLGQLDNLTKNSPHFQFAEEYTGHSVSPAHIMRDKLAIDGMIRDGVLQFQWSYSGLHYQESTIEQLSASYLTHLKTLIQFSSDQGKIREVFTPSDYGLPALVNYEALDEFLMQPGWPGNVLKRADTVDAIYQLSALQEGMLFHSLYNAGGTDYIEQFSCDLQLTDPEALQQSWNLLLKQHTVLRSSINYKELAIPVQCVHHEVELPFEILDYSHLNADDQQLAINAYVKIDRERPFDFEVPPLMRITLLQTGNESYHMLWTYHHILLDGWSLPVIIESILRYYNQLVSKEEVILGAEDKYEDYIRFIAHRDKWTEEVYWKEYLSGLETNTSLPFVKPSGNHTKVPEEFKEERLILNEETSQTITAYAKRNGLTLNTLMQGVWAFILHHYTGHNSIAYGVAVSGRPVDLADIEKRVGLYINTLPLHTRFEKETAIISWLQDIQRDQIRSREYEHIPLSQIQELTGIKGDLFDSLLVFENYPVSEVLKSEDWKLKVDHIDVKEQTNYPLVVVITASKETELRFTYNAGALDTIYVQQLARHFEQVLAEILAHEQGKLGHITLLTAQERERLLQYAGTEKYYPADKTITDLFEEQVWKTPDAVAVVEEDKFLTYAELNHRANRLARYLKYRGVKTETLVPICTNRSLDMIVGILGILKAGGAYVPVDPAYPQERIRFMLEDTGSRLLLTTLSYREQLAGQSDESMIICLDESIEFDEEQLDTEEVLLPEQLAYVMYTSGSTGQPKGVLVTHRNVVSLIHAANYIVLDKEDVLLSVGSIAFDATTFEYWGALLNGGRLVLGAENSLLDPVQLKRVLQEEGVTKMFFTTAWFNQLVDTDVTVFGRLSAVLTGGEKLSENHVKRFMQAYPEIVISNIYGPTENTTFSLSYVMNNQEITVNTPIGISLDNRSAYVLDQDQQLVPMGVTGELYVGGEGVARGYLNRPELTLERFITNPFHQDPAKRLYRTGDLVRMHLDGNIEFVGRSDNQVKIRGYRIELGEIENVLRQNSMVRNCVVVAKADRTGGKRLIGYVVEEEMFDKEKMNAWLKVRLPEYMVPSVWLTLEEIPLTVNGKTDYAVLPDPDINDLSINEYEAPRDETETKLIAVWQSVLNIQRINIHDDFFELGGHSLLAIRLLAAVRNELAVELSVDNVFTYTTVATMTAFIQQMESTVLLPEIVRQERPENIPLSFGQERLWFIDQLEGSVHYHIPAVLCLKGDLDVNALQTTFQDIVNRHEILRTVIGQKGGVPYQQILEPGTWKLSVVNPGADQQATILNFINQPFDLANDHMLRIGLIEIAGDEHLMVLSLHHIASDGWSLSVIVGELSELYNAYTSGLLPSLRELTLKYADYALWQRNYVSGEVLQLQQEYWKTQLSGTELLNLPTDYSRSAISSKHGTTTSFMLDPLLKEELNEFSQREGVTLFMTLLTTFKILLYRYSGQEDICVGTPIAGRRQKETENLVGFFINTLAVRCDLSGEPAFNALLKQVKDTFLAGYAQQDIPFEKVVESVVTSRDLNQNPLFQVLFTLQNIPDIPAFALNKLDVSVQTVPITAVQFDLTFTVVEEKEGLLLNIEYCSELFRGETITRMVGHYEQLLRSVIAQPTQKISALAMIPPVETSLLETLFSGPVVDYPKEKTVMMLFEEWAIQTPDAVALQYEEEKITYQELNERANQLAHYLRGKDIHSDCLVGICIGRSTDMIAGILGIWKAGGAYVPIDPGYPEERIGYLLADSGVNVIVSNKRSRQSLPVEKQALIISLDEDDLLSQQPVTSPEHLTAVDNLSYVIYTSGSTGKPKGVLVEHRGMLNHLYAKVNELQMDNHTILAYTASYTFDISVWQMFCALLCGGRTVIYSDYLILQPAALMEQVEADRVSILELVPSYLAAVLQENTTATLKCLRYLLVTGEAVSQALLAQWFSHPDYRNIPVVNAYGPTEASDDITHHFMYSTPAGSNVPLGKTIQNLHIYILDTYGHICPVGVPGEICVAGVGVSRGYLNREELTREKFVQDPFHSGQRMYKTGDLGKWLPDGNIEYQGRIDDQVKIRGYRIELGEIEHVLNQHPLVLQSVVIAKSDTNGMKRLIAYFVPSKEEAKEELFTYLKSSLPEYMVPVLVELDELPLTANGKIDKKSLPDPTGEMLLTNVYVGPQNPTEEVLAEICQQLLGIERIGVDDNLFEIGMHSLLVMRLIAATLEEFKIDIPVRTFFELATIRLLAEYIITRQANSAKKRTRIVL